MKAEDSFISQDGADVARNELRNGVALAQVASIIGKVLLAGAGFVVGSFLGFWTALAVGWIDFGC